MDVNAFRSSVRNLSNWKLYLPDVIFVFSTLAFGLLFGYLSGVSSDLLRGASIEDKIEIFLADKNKLFSLTYSFIAFLVANFFIGAGLMSAKYCMMRDVISGKPVNLRKSFFSDGPKYMVKFIFVKILTYYVFFIPALILGFKSYIEPLFYGASPELGWLVLLVFGVSMQLLSILLDIIFFFKWPQLFFNNWEIRRTIRNAFRFTKNHLLLVIFTWAFIFILGMCMNLVIISLGGINIFIISIFWFTLIILLFRILIKLFYDVWKDLFLFQVYFNYKHR